MFTVDAENEIGKDSFGNSAFTKIFESYLLLRTAIVLLFT
jgi:hypothetical protein